MPVNELLPAPKPPGSWVDARACVCGESYEDFRAWPSFSQAALRVRAANGGFGEGGGFRSRGPVLWAMRVIKLEAWYLAHLGCRPASQPCKSCETLCPWCRSSMAHAHGLAPLGGHAGEQLETCTESYAP